MESPVNVYAMIETLQNEAEELVTLEGAQDKRGANVITLAFRPAMPIRTQMAGSSKKA